MKKLLSLCLSIVLVFALAACNSTNHDGEAKTPSGSRIQKGRDYQTVVASFEEKGFTNIQLLKLDDLITGWLTKEGKVEYVTVDGDENYSADTWYLSDVEVVIAYHTFPNEDASNPSAAEVTESTTTEEPATDILTVDNCEELLNILTLKADMDSSYKDFSEKYRGQKVAFDARIDFKDNHYDFNPFTGTYTANDSVYDILISYGNYDPDHQIGPTIRIESITSRLLGYDTSKTLPDFISIGSNVQVVLRVGEYDEETGIFEMRFVSIEAR